MAMGMFPCGQTETAACRGMHRGPGGCALLSMQRTPSCVHYPAPIHSGGHQTELRDGTVAVSSIPSDTTSLRTSTPRASNTRLARSTVTPWYSLRSSRLTWDSWTPSRSAKSRWVIPRMCPFASGQHSHSTSLPNLPHLPVQLSRPLCPGSADCVPLALPVLIGLAPELSVQELGEYSAAR